jgi:hypothetical protein
MPKEKKRSPCKRKVEKQQEKKRWRKKMKNGNRAKKMEIE